MTHLTFLPDGPSFFLWGSAEGRVDPVDPVGPADPADPADPARTANFIVRELAFMGKSAAACVVGAAGRAAIEGGCSIALLDILPVLAAVPCSMIERLPASIGVWSTAAKLALDLVARGRMAPVVSAAASGQFEARWRVSLALRGDGERAAAIAAAMPPAAHAALVEVVGPNADAVSAGEGGRAEVQGPEATLRAFLDASADVIVREAVALRVAHVAEIEGEGGAERGSRRGPGVRAGAQLGLDRRAPWELRFVFGLVSEEAALDPADASGTSVAPELNAWASPALEAPPAERARALNEAGIEAIVPGELERGGARRLRLRMRLGVAAKGARAGGGTDEEGAGTPPPPRSQPRPTHDEAAFPGDVDLLLQAAIRFRWEVAVGDAPITLDELEEIRALGAPIARWRRTWIGAGLGEIEEASALVAQGGGILPARAGLRAALEGSVRWPGVSVPVDVVPVGVVGAAIQALRAAREWAPPARPAGLRADLLPHEERAFAWLARMASLGLGGCLADGPGIDKVGPIVALILHRREVDAEDRRPVLIVCSEAAERSFARAVASLAPSLLVALSRAKTGSSLLPATVSLAESEGAAIALASYDALLESAGHLAAVEWSTVIIDSVERAGERVLDVVRLLRARRRVVLTALPIEERMGDLFAAINLVSPGLLGSSAEFLREIALPIERFREAYASARLARLASPFVLRRRASDPVVLRDIRAGRVFRVPCALTREQAALYRRHVALGETLRRIERARAEGRRDLILSLAETLAQICDHPAAYLEQAGPASDRSGKLQRLAEILREVLAAGERAIVMAPSRPMSELLAADLTARLCDASILLLNGNGNGNGNGDGAVPARASLIHAFESSGDARVLLLAPLPPASMLALDPGAADHIFCFGYRSAALLEEAVSRRARGPGRGRAAQVHALVTAGTLEERIWDRIEASAALLGVDAGTDVATGAAEAERWLTSLDEAALRSALLLSSEAIFAGEQRGHADVAARGPSPLGVGVVGGRVRASLAVSGDPAPPVGRMRG